MSAYEAVKVALDPTRQSSTSGFRNIRKTDLEGVESMLTKEDVIEKLRSGELTPQDIAANGWMCSVTQRISKIKQPRGGYIKPKEFEQTMLDGGALTICIQ